MISSSARWVEHPNQCQPSWMIGHSVEMCRVKLHNGISANYDGEWKMRMAVCKRCGSLRSAPFFGGFACADGSRRDGEMRGRVRRRHLHTLALSPHLSLPPPCHDIISHPSAHAKPPKKGAERRLPHRLHTAHPAGAGGAMPPSRFSLKTGLRSFFEVVYSCNPPPVHHFK